MAIGKRRHLSGAQDEADPDDRPISRRQKTESKCSSLLSDGRFLRVFFRRCQDGEQSARPRIDCTNEKRRWRRSPDGRRPRAIGQRIPLPARRTGLSRSDLRTTRTPDAGRFPRQTRYYASRHAGHAMRRTPGLRQIGAILIGYRLARRCRISFEKTPFFSNFMRSSIARFVDGLLYDDRNRLRIGRPNRAPSHERARNHYASRRPR